MTTVQQCWDHYAQHHLSRTVEPETNLRLWRRMLWWADKDAERLSPMEVDQYVALRGVKPSTVNRELAMLRAALRHSERHGLISRAPYIKSVPGASPRQRALSPDEARRLIEAADQHGNWREMVFVRLALATGARSSALTDLTWDRVLDGVMDFRKTGGHVRMKRRAVVPINQLAQLALQIAKRHRDGPYVLHWQGAKLRAPRKMFARLAKRAGVADCSPHILRHTVASLLLARGEDLLKVSRLIGHANSTITEQTYFQHPPSWLKSVTDRIDYSSERTDVAVSSSDTRASRRTGSGGRSPSRSSRSG